MNDAVASRRPEAAASGVPAFVAARPVGAAGLALLLTSLVFIAVPGIDLAVSRLFFHDGAGFPASLDPALIGLRSVGTWIFFGGCVVAVAALLGPLLLSGRRIGLSPRAGLFLTASLILGPGLIVNVLFKDLWGRARPIEILEFGGIQPFSPPWAIVHHCRLNCSFMSGEASSAMWLLGFAMIAPLALRRWAVLVGLVLTALLSLNRIAFGGHFLSDVVLAWLTTLIVLLVVHRVVYRPDSPFTNHAIAAALGAFGDRAKVVLARMIPRRA